MINNFIDNLTNNYLLIYIFIIILIFSIINIANLITC